MFSRFFIDRPIFASVVSIVILLAGGLSLATLPVAQYPEITPPAVTISINYPGASAQVVADTVAAPIEQQVNGVPGMIYMSSSSGNDGSYSLTVTFEIGTNLNAALVMVQNRVQLALPQLPTPVQLQGITVRKRTPDLIMIVGFTSPTGQYDRVYLSNYATVNIRDPLLRLEGVSDISVFGQRDYSMRLWLDPHKLAARNLTAMDVAAAVRSQNTAAAPGGVGQALSGRSRSFQFPFQTVARLSSVEEFENIVVKASAPRLPDFSTGTGGAGTTGAGRPLGFQGVGGFGSQPGTGPASSLATSTQSSVPSPFAPLTSSAGSNAPLSVGPATSIGTSSLGGVGAISPMNSFVSRNPLAAVIGGLSSAPANTPTVATMAGGTVGPNGLHGGTLDGGPNPASGVVRIKDVARVELAASTYDNGSTFDGQLSVGLAVRLLPGANALEVGDRVKERLEELKLQFPEDLRAEVAYDTTPFIRESIDDVVDTLFQAVGLVALVVLVFLQSWRAALIPMIAVPVAIIGTFAIMKLLGFTINNISLFGLVLAIGIVVDDAIVVVENCERWLDRGLSPKEAAYKAMEEVTGPIIAIALILSAVFIPTAFVGGIPGQFYRQFAVTITASTILSAINSLTLSPALAALLLRSRHAKSSGPGSRIARIMRYVFAPLSFAGWLFNRVFEFGTAVYTWTVGRLVRAAVIVLVLYCGLVWLTYVSFLRAPIGFVPEQDQGRLIINIQLPDSASLNRTTATLAEVDRIARETEGVAHTTSAAGVSFVGGGNSSNNASLFVVLDPFAQRQKPHLRASAIIAKLQRDYAKFTDGEIKVFSSSPVPGLSPAGGFKIMVEDRGGLGLAELQKQTDAVVAKLGKEPSVTRVLTQFRSRTPQLYLDVDRTKVESLGVDLNDVNQTMQIYLGSLYANSFNTLGRRWQVKLQADRTFRNQIDDVRLLQVRNKNGEMIPLSTLVKLRDVNGPLSVARYNLYSAAAVSGSVPADISSGEAIEAVNRVAGETLPRSMTTEWTELFFLQIRTGNTAIIVFLLAVAFVFLALAALYESWALPLAVILVVPLCMLCSVEGVRASGKSVDIFVQIGLVVLVGLTCKNSILIVEFAEVLRKEGKPRHVAAVESSHLRLRPILMTSMAFILGVVPLMIASGAGAEMRRSLGISVFWGMLGVTAFGIFLTPVFFVLIQWAAARRDSPIVGRMVGLAFGTGTLGAAAGLILAEVEVIDPVRPTALGAAAGAAFGLVLYVGWHVVKKLRRRHGIQVVPREAR